MMGALNHALSDLESAERALHQRWEHAKSLWNDPVSRGFETDYFIPIQSQMQATFKEMQQLAQTIDAARRAVSNLK